MKTWHTLVRALLTALTALGLIAAHRPSLIRYTPVKKSGCRTTVPRFVKTAETNRSLLPGRARRAGRASRAGRAPRVAGAWRVEPGPGGPR